MPLIGLEQTRNLHLPTIWNNALQETSTSNCNTRYTKTRTAPSPPASSCQPPRPTSHRLTMSSPPANHHVQDEPVSSPATEDPDNTTPMPEQNAARPVTNPPNDPPNNPPNHPPNIAWSNFHAHIQKDDIAMAAKARQEQERLGGEAFRPEMRETYKDQRGESETAVHEKVEGGGVSVEKEEDEVQEEEDVKEVQEEVQKDEYLDEDNEEGGVQI